MVQNDRVPVTTQRHSKCSWHRFASYDFARTTTVCELVASEIAIVAASFPIGFLTDGELPRPVCIMSVLEGEPNPFVADDGRWLAPYVPSALRCHPFHAAPADRRETGHANTFTLLVDETTGLVSPDSTGLPFFTPDMTPSQELGAVISFMRRYVAEQEAAVSACAVFAELKLFAPLQPGGPLTLDLPLCGIDFARLAELSPPETSLMMTSGAMQIAYSHRVSLAHCEWLGKLQLAARQTQSACGTSQPSELDGFLTAVAAAQSKAQDEAAHAFV